MSRGLRNNNPLNIRHSSAKWQGRKATQTDRSFVQFVSPEWGYRAALKILRAYYNKHHLHTLRAVISRWAPPNENHTDVYVAAVAKRAGIAPDAPLRLSDKDFCVKLLEAMCLVENGVPGNLYHIQKGVELAG